MARLIELTLAIALAASMALTSAAPAKAGVAKPIAEGTKVVVRCAKDAACRAEVQDKLRELAKNLGSKMGHLLDEVVIIWDDLTTDHEAEEIKRRLDRLEAMLRDAGVLDADTRREIQLMLDRLRKDAV